MYQRGDVVEVEFIIPDKNGIEKHPAIVLSNEDMYSIDECYLVAMITHYNANDVFTYKLEPDMFIGEFKTENSQVRCHLVTYVREKDLIQNKYNSKMKRNEVNRLVEFIAEVAMGE